MKNEGERECRKSKVRSVVDHAARTHTEQREVPGPGSRVLFQILSWEYHVEYVWVCVCVNKGHFR